MQLPLNDISEIEKTWSKVEYVSKKTGMRDGLSDGKDTAFQPSFDIGFKEGFQNGYKLGKLRGIAMAKSKLKNVQRCVSQDEEKMSRARCVVCENNELLNNNIDEIIQKQQSRFVDN